MRGDDLVPLLVNGGKAGVGFRQGKVLSFNVDTGANTIEVGGAVLHNVPALNVTDAAGLEPGMIVGLLTYQGTWWIIGRVARPGTRDFGDIVLRDDDGSMLRLKNSTIELVPAPGIENVYGRIFTANQNGRLWMEIRPPQSEEPQDNGLFIEGASVGTMGATWIAGSGYVEVRSDSGVVNVEARDNAFLQSLSGAVNVEARNNVFLRSLNSDINLQAPGDVWFQNDGDVIFSNDTWVLFQPAGSVDFRATQGNVHVKYGSATSSPNAVVGTDGRLYRSSASSRRYKYDIRPLEHDPKDVLKLQPVTWHDIWQDTGDENKPRIPGFIAEDVHEAGLTEYVQYDDEGRPDGLNYDRMTAALLSVLKDHEKRIAELEAKVASLEARLAEQGKGEADG